MSEISDRKEQNGRFIQCMWKDTIKKRRRENLKGRWSLGI